MRLLIVALAVLVLATPADAAEIRVTTSTDSIADDGQCSLREAIIAANTNVAGSGCPAGEPTATDTVVLGPTGFRLARAGAGEDDSMTGDLDVRSGGPLVIEGRDGAIDAQSIDRVLDVVDAGASLTLENVSVTRGAAPDGQPGGGIVSAGTVTLIDSAVTRNRIDGAAPGFVGGLGGGIFSSGTLSLVNTTVSDNFAGDGGAGAAGLGFAGGHGGGIYAVGTTTIARSTILRNAGGAGGPGDTGQAGGEGGSGAGLFVGPGGTATVTNTLFAGNTGGHGGDGGNRPDPGPGGAGGSGGGGAGLGAKFADVSVRFSTFIDGVVGSGGVAGSGSFPGPQGPVGVGSAVAADAQTTLSRTIAAGSCFGPLGDGGANLAAAGGGCPGSTAAANLDAAGAPLAGSAAIDGAPLAGCPSTDLLGTGRPQGVRCDIGAVEARAAAPTGIPASLAFGARRLGVATTRVISARNPGLPGLLLSPIVTGAADFRASESCPPVLVSGGTCAVTVRFVPSRAGLRSARLTLAGRQVALSGAGIAPPAQPQTQCVVPRLKGKTVKRARKALRRAHCTLGTVTRRGRGRRGRIRSSKPKAGSVLAAGAAVDVVVNRRRARPRR